MANEAEFEGFERDATKSEAIYEQRVDFEAAARVFDGDYVEHEDLRRGYGEPRYIVIGSVEDAVITVVWTPRGRLRRIISAWPSSNRERREYRDYREAVGRTNPIG